LGGDCFADRRAGHSERTGGVLTDMARRVLADARSQGCPVEVQASRSRCRDMTTTRNKAWDAINSGKVIQSCGKAQLVWTKPNQSLEPHGARIRTRSAEMKLLIIASCQCYVSKRAHCQRVGITGITDLNRSQLSCTNTQPQPLNFVFRASSMFGGPGTAITSSTSVRRG
jgi:hypothetical protein